MKVTCDRTALVDAINLVGGVVVARSPKPVLGCVYLKAEDQTLSLSATDLEIALAITTPRVEIPEAGEALIPAEKLNQIVRESSDTTLTIESEAEATHIRGEDAHFKIFGYPVADFPSIPSFQGEPEFTIESAPLARLVHQTAFATARENSRYAINGVLLEREGNQLIIVATDGRRLALARGTCQGAGGENTTTSAIIPVKTLTLLSRLLQETEGEVRVSLGDNQILFGTDHATLSSNLVEGNFPPYRDVIPKDNDRKATIATDVLSSAVRRAALLTNQDSKGVRMSFSESGLDLSSRAPEMGEAEIHSELAAWEGEPLEIGFNPQFLLDALKVIQEEQVTIEFKDAGKPGTLKTGPDYLYVIMPVSLE